MKHRAFTMIEMLISLSVLAIACAMIIPLSGSTTLARADAAARILRADIEYAQVRTIAHPDDPVSLVLAEDGSGWWVARSSDPDVPLPHERTGEPYEVILGQGRASMTTNVGVTSTGLHGRILQFDSLGGLNGPLVDPVISLRCDTSEVQLTVHASTGFIQIQD